MKKNVIALAVAAALAAPLAAQAEVSVTGGLQAELAIVGGDGTAGVPKGMYAMDGMEYGKENSGNYGYLKFAASEDLGGGMKALAVYNMQTAVDDVLATRDAYVGLTGGFGTVLAGKLATPYKSSTVKWDPFLATTAQARGSFGMSTLHNGYVNNAVAYANKFGPATFVAAIVLDEAADPTDGTKTNGKNGVSLSVNAPVGPVEVAVAYLDVSEMGGGAKNATAVKVGVKWTAGAITVAGQYEALDKGLGTSDNGDNDLYLTGSYAMGANTVSAGFGQNVVKTSGASDKTNTYMAVGVKHAFSKTTSVHAVYRASVNDMVNKADENVIAAGLRVGF
jgi:predicted porin